MSAPTEYDFCDFEDCTVDATWLSSLGQSFCPYHAADGILAGMDQDDRDALVVSAWGYRHPPKPPWRLSPSKTVRDWFVVLGPYDQAFVAAIKSELPTSDRDWNPGLRAWSVHSRSKDAILRIIRRLS